MVVNRSAPPSSVVQVLIYEDSYGRLCLAVNQGSAASAPPWRQVDRASC